MKPQCKECFKLKCSRKNQKWHLRCAGGQWFTWNKETGDYDEVIYSAQVRQSLHAMLMGRKAVRFVSAPVPCPTFEPYDD